MRRFPGYGEYIMPAEKRPRRSFWTAAAFLHGEDLMDRIMISGVSSGCGKTTVVCAVLQALLNRGLKTGAFKCGPDYIDPMFHSRIIGAKSANLDLHFFSENTPPLPAREKRRGVRGEQLRGGKGFYDGAGLTTWKTSAYELALRYENAGRARGESRAARRSRCSRSSKGFCASGPRAASAALYSTSVPP